MKPTFFRAPADLRKWFAKNHKSKNELWVGFHKKASGTPSITWPESVDEALAVGWIDGVRKRLDDSRYVIRFTPRKPRSVWSVINIRRAQELVEAGRMRRAGLAAFQARTENRSGIYAYEQRRDVLPKEYARILARNPAASAFVKTRTSAYLKKCFWFVVSAKQEETRRRRLASLIEAWAEGDTVPRAGHGRKMKWF